MLLNPCTSTIVGECFLVLKVQFMLFIYNVSFCLDCLLENNLEEKHLNPHLFTHLLLLLPVHTPWIIKNKRNPIYFIIYILLLVYVFILCSSLASHVPNWGYFLVLLYYHGNGVFKLHGRMSIAKQNYFQRFRVFQTFLSILDLIKVCCVFKTNLIWSLHSLPAHPYVNKRDKG